MAQQTLGEIKNVNPTTEIQEVWRCQASPNVDHDVLCSIEDSVIESTALAVINADMNFKAAIKL